MLILAGKYPSERLEQAITTLIHPMRRIVALLPGAPLASFGHQAIRPVQQHGLENASPVWHGDPHIHRSVKGAAWHGYLITMSARTAAGTQALLRAQPCAIMAGGGTPVSVP